MSQTVTLRVVREARVVVDMENGCVTSVKWSSLADVVDSARAESIPGSLGEDEAREILRRDVLAILRHMLGEDDDKAMVR